VSAETRIRDFGVVGRLVVRVSGGGVVLVAWVLSVVYWSLRRLLELVMLRFRSEREKEIEIPLLRHQLRVLERQASGLR
jgi:hypothetical protein